MKLIVGLGNPGREYSNTRHNIGYMYLDSIAKDKGLVFDNEKFNAKYTVFNCNDDKVLLVKPLSYMNLSGGVVKKFIDYYKIKLDDMLIVQDDLDMRFGRIKIVYDSSSGGHNGIKDIESKIGTRKYARLKIGISNDKSLDTKDYVLGKFTDIEMKELFNIYDGLINLVDDFCILNLDKLMSKYNSK